MGVPRVAVVVLTYDSAGVIVGCLDHIGASAYGPLEVVVVDNASTDDTVERVRATHREVAVVRAPQNLGWSGGNRMNSRRYCHEPSRYAW